MDKELYELMQELLEEKRTKFTKDIEYLGTVSSDEVSKTGKATITTDIFMIVDEMPDGSVAQKFYDGDKNFIAGRNVEHDRDSEIYLANNFKADRDFLTQIENLANDNQGISLNKYDALLEKVARELGVDKSEISNLRISDLKQKVDAIEKKKEDEPKLTLDEDNEENKEQDKEQVAKQNREALVNMSSKKQEIDLSQKIDDKHSLYEVMGVPEGTIMLTVHKDAIASSSRNTGNNTRWAHAFLYPDGTVHSADGILTQVGGISSDRTVYKSNRDGSSVEELKYESTYRINSPSFKNATISTRMDDQGYIDVVYGLEDPTHNQDIFAEPLETDRTYYTTRTVRNELSAKKGEYNVTDKIDEIEEHKEHGCDNLSLREADGREDTGHSHDESVVELIMSDKDKGKMIRDNFDKETVAMRYEEIAKSNKGRSPDELIKMTIYSLESDLINRDEDRNPYLKDHEEEDEHIPNHDFYNH